MIKVRSFDWIGSGRPFSFVGAGIAGLPTKFPKSMMKVKKTKKKGK